MKKFLIASLLGASCLVLAATRQVSWDLPTEYEDGTPLPASEIASITVSCDSGDTFTFQGAVTGGDIDLPPGVHTCEARALAVNGEESAPSNSFTRVIAQPRPNPPSNFFISNADASVIIVEPPGGPAPFADAQIRETPEQIAIHLPASYVGTLDSTYAATVRYRVDGASTWNTGHPLYHVRPGQAEDAFSGIIFDLQPGTSYEVEVTITNGTTSTVYGETELGLFTTRALPASVSGQTPDATPSTVSAVQTAISAASPGDIIEIQDGTYNLTDAWTVDADGTLGNEIYIRGESKTGVIVNTATPDRGFEVEADYIVIENMTIDGGNAARAENTGAIGIQLATTVSTVTDITVRDVVMTDVVRAIQTAGGSTGGLSHRVLAYNNDVTGTLDWSEFTLTGNDGANNYWTNDGFRFVGYGNAAWNNKIEGFSDGITFAHSVDETAETIEAAYAYRNLLRNCIDNSFELDHAYRLSGIYDNYVENCSTGISQSDNSTVNYGPSYLFRNTFVNIFSRWVKLNSSWEGWHHYNNAYLRTISTEVGGSDTTWDEGFVQASPTGDDNDRWVYRNNIHIARHNPATDLLNFRVHPSGASFEFSHNAWYPDNERVRLENFGPSYSGGITAAIAATDTHNNLYPSSAGLTTNNRYFQFDHLSESNPWAATITLGADSNTEVTGQASLALDAASALKNEGVAIPGITDGFSGAAPDMGPVIAGRAAVTYGPTAAPSWFESAPDGEWFAVTTTNNGSDVGMVQGNFSNFTGAAVDQRDKRVVYANPGGHQNTWQNGVWALNLNTENPFWERLVDNTLVGSSEPTASGNNGDADYSDNTPRAIHHYDSGPYVIDGTLWVPAMPAQYSPGPSGSQIYSLDLDALGSTPVAAASAGWTLEGRGIPTSFSTGGSSHKIEQAHSSYDRDTGLIWVGTNFSTTGAYPFWSINPSTGTITQTASWGSAQWPLPSTRGNFGHGVIADGTWIVVAPSSSFQKVAVVDLSNPTSANSQEMNDSNSPTWANLEEASGHYDPNTRRVYFKASDQSTMITLDVPADSYNGTYTWGTLPQGGSVSPTGEGKFNQFNMVDDMGGGRGALIYTGNSRQNDEFYMYKLPTS